MRGYTPESLFIQRRYVIPRVGKCRARSDKAPEPLIFMKENREGSLGLTEMVFESRQNVQTLN